MRCPLSSQVAPFPVSQLFPLLFAQDIPWLFLRHSNYPRGQLQLQLQHQLHRWALLSCLVTLAGLLPRSSSPFLLLAVFGFSSSFCICIEMSKSKARQGLRLSRCPSVLFSTKRPRPCTCPATHCSYQHCFEVRSPQSAARSPQCPRFFYIFIWIFCVGFPGERRQDEGRVHNAAAAYRRGPAARSALP